MTNKLKVAFIRVNCIADEIIPPLHFGYLAASLPNSYQITLIDMLRDGISNKLLTKKIRDGNFDLICFSSYSKDITNIRNLSLSLKENCPNSLIVLGGVQPSLMPKATMKYVEPGIDFCFAGEGEESLPMFIKETGCKDFSYKIIGKIPGLIFKHEGEIKINKPQFIEDLDSIPFPKWDIMPPATYPKSPHGAFFRHFPYAPMIASRGCPFPCTFCSAPVLSGKKVRFRSIENIIEEIEILKKNYDVNEIHFEDDNFSLTKKFVNDFCEALLKNNLNIAWCFPNGLRLEKLDINILRLMRRAGCYSMNVGVESGCDDILKRIEKKTTAQALKENISRVKKAGMDIGGFFIIGFPGETRENILQTIRFATSLELDRIGVSYFQPLPGSKEFNNLVSSGKFTYDLSLMKPSLHTISYVNDNLTARELYWLRRKAFFAFYFRWKIIIKLAGEVRNLSHFWSIAKRGIRWFIN